MTCYNRHAFSPIISSPRHSCHSGGDSTPSWRQFGLSARVHRLPLHHCIAMSYDGMAASVSHGVWRNGDWFWYWRWPGETGRSV